MLTLEQAVLPLDLVRGASLRFLSKSRALTLILGKRETRIAALGALQVFVVFLVTLRFPVGLYFVGPVMLGVVHLAADVRYLALRRRPPRALLGASVLLAALLTVVRVFVGLHVADVAQGARLDMGVGIAWIAVALLLRWRRSPGALLVAIPLLGAVGLTVVAHAEICDVALTHLHNVIAVVVWLSLFRSRPGWTALPVVLVVAATAALLSGAFLPWTAQHGGLLAFGQTVSRLGAALAPGAPPRLAAAVVMAFVFLQSVHYAVWTAWIPQDCLKGEGTPTFRMTLRSLLADFGHSGLAVVVGATLLFAGLACWKFCPSVVWYLSLVRAHAWLEIAVFAFFVGRPAADEPRHAECTYAVS